MNLNVTATAAKRAKHSFKFPCSGFRILFADYPRVTVGPENPIRVERDDTAELFCQVDSKPKVQEVRWVRDIRFVQTQFRHLIPRANLKDEGIYICNADNGLGQVKY